jgi:NitT/TauT family transport system permease protein
MGHGTAMIKADHPSPDIRSRVGAAWVFIRPFLIVLGSWETIIWLNFSGNSFVPAPSTILIRFWELTVSSGVLLRHLGSSLYRMVLGYLLAVGLGILSGIFMASSKILKEIFSPILSMLISVPTIAWVPVLLVTMGLGDRTVITAIFLGGYFAITFNTMRGIEMIDRDLINASRIMGVRGLDLLRQVLIPASLVSIITGLRLGIGYSWRALVGGEMLSALVQWGVGKMIYQARFWNDLSAMFVGLIVIGLTGVLLDRLLLKWLERETIEKWGMVAER